ncbi:MAG: oligosaccharide flippase family protein [Candidatus Sericytochromatia bacterium]|nr:oligosaccharide flippase family protein [Candidatus Sericytochromatia bacterium]
MESEAPVRNQVGRGVAALVARYGLITPLSLVASVLLARWLAPAAFGAYASVAFLVLGLGSLFELGLVSVLIQQRERPTPHEQRTVFTAYLALFGAMALALAAAAPWLAAWFRLPPDGAAMARCMTLPMLLGVLGCIPTVMLERDMRFGTLAAIEVAGTVAEKGVTLGLAWGGYGSWSFVWGAVAAVGLRMALLNAAAPWPVGLAWDRGVLRTRLAHGVWFQGINVAFLVRENLATLVAGPACGPHAVGLLNWSAALATLLPSNALVIAQRVTFPALARLQDAPAEAAELLRLTLRRLCLVTAAPSACLLVLAEPIVRHVYGPAWLEALPLLAWMVARAGVAQLFTPLLVFLNARGEAAVGLRLMLATTGLEWGLALALLPEWGPAGVAAGAALGGALPALAVARRVQATAPLRPVRTFGPGLAVAGMLAAAAALGRPHVTSWQALASAFLGLVLAWGLAVAWLERALLRAWWAGRREQAAAPREAA